MKSKNRPSEDFDPLSDLEMQQIKTRLLSSVEKHKVKRKIVRYTFATAASVALLLGSGWFFIRKESPSITDFVKTASEDQIRKSKEVTLILGKGEQLNLNEDDPAIAYSASGQQVTVGTSTAVDQQTLENEKVVYNTLIVPYGKRSELKLSDGSQVWLNSGSRLVYPAVFQGDKREVYLEGEAIFEVTHNKKSPFVVLSVNQEIEVLGTVFNVNNYLEEKRVFTVLKSGSVKISHKENTSDNYENSFEIVPGILAGFEKKTSKITTEKVDVDTYFSWRKGVFIFQNDNLSTIMRRLSRYYNVAIKIDSESLAQDTFSGYLDVTNGIEKVLEIIKQTTNLEYSVLENQTITITTKSV